MDIYSAAHMFLCTQPHSHASISHVLSDMFSCKFTPIPSFVHPTPWLAHTSSMPLCAQLLKQNQGLLMRLLSGTLEATLTLPYPINAEWTVSINRPQGTRRSQRRHLAFPVRSSQGACWWQKGQHFGPPDFTPCIFLQTLSLLVKDMQNNLSSNPGSSENKRIQLTTSKGDFR